MRRFDPVNLTLKAIFLFVALGACTNLGQFVWVDDYVKKTPGPPASTGYVIAPGDLISIRVYGQDAMSARGRVRPDGKISMPLLNDVEVAGYTPTALAQQLQVRLKEFIHQPAVTVSLEEPKLAQVSLLGEVSKPGQYQLNPTNTGVLQAIAMAGGLTDFAHRDRIFVLRQASAAVRIRFRYDGLVRAESGAAQFRLQDGDVLVIE